MNIINVLWALGWEVLSFTENGEYKIQLSETKKNLIDKKLNDGLIGYKGSTSDTYNVRVCNVKFNNLGNLYVSFEDAKTGIYIDSYEYKVI